MYPVANTIRPTQRTMNPSYHPALMAVALVQSALFSSENVAIPVSLYVEFTGDFAGLREPVSPRRGSYGL